MSQFIGNHTMQRGRAKFVIITHYEKVDIACLMEITTSNTPKETNSLNCWK
jgi:hypothetical protein